MDRAQKEKVVEELGQIFESSGVVVVSHYAGLTVAEMQDLRARARQGGSAVRVAKNRLAKIALDGMPCAGIADFLTGMTVLTFSEDPVAAAKTLVEFAKSNNKLTIVGGSIDGKVLDKSGVEALAKLPSLDELRGKLVGLLQAPAGKLARVAQAPAGKLARVIKAREDQLQSS